MCDKLQAAMDPGAVNMLSVDYPDLFDPPSGSSDDALALQASNGAGMEASSSKSSEDVALAPSPPITGEPSTRPSILGDSSDSEDDLLDS